MNPAEDLLDLLAAGDRYEGAFGDYPVLAHGDRILISVQLDERPSDAGAYGRLIEMRVSVPRYSSLLWVYQERAFGSLTPAPS